MPTLQMNGVVQQLRRVALRRDCDDMTDAQLLDCFILHGQEAAFEALVRRHGPMVLGVCQRMLGHQQDAEDAFQTVFLVLVRKGDSIWPRAMVGNWLYGVACQTAQKARALAAKRRTREKQVADMPEPEARPDKSRDLQAILDQELTCLPERFRAPLVLCDLQGSTRKDAAQQLGWPEGTLSSRLARARAMLAKRLTRHGLLFSGGALAAWLAQNAASAAMPHGLAISTVNAASAYAAGTTAATGLISANVAALTEGVLHAMLFTKLKIASLTALIAAVLLGIGGSFIPQLDLGNEAAAGQAGATEPTTPIFVAAEKRKPAADDAEDRKKPSTDVSGVVNAVDAKKNVVNVTLPSVVKGQPGEDKLLDLAKDVKVLFDDGKGVKPASFRDGSLVDLKVGALIVAEMSADQKLVVAIRVQGPLVAGILKTADADKGVITLILRSKGADDQERTVMTAKGARVLIEGNEAKLQDLAVDMLVTLKLAGDQKVAGMVLAQWPSVQGILRGVDADKRTIALATPKKFDPDGETSYPVAKDVKVQLYGRDAALKDLPKDTPVVVKLMGSKKEVASIQATGPMVSGLLKSVDAKTNSVTLLIAARKNLPAEEKTFSVVKDAKVEIATDKFGKLTDLDKDRQVILWLSLDQSAVVSISTGKKGTK